MEYSYSNCHGFIVALREGHDLMQNWSRNPLNSVPTSHYIFRDTKICPSSLHSMISCKRSDFYNLFKLWRPNEKKWKLNLLIWKSFVSDEKYTFCVCFYSNKFVDNICPWRRGSIYCILNKSCINFSWFYSHQERKTTQWASSVLRVFQHLIRA